MTTDFIALNLHPDLMQAVAERGYAEPMPIQSAVIPMMIAGQDVIGQAQTGTGKTAAYALPILQNLQTEQWQVQALVLVPTRELAVQVADAVSTYGKHSGAHVLAVYGGQSYGLQIGRLKRGVHIVVGTPGRLIDLIQRELLDLSHVRTVILDEADEMLSMGFVEDIETILSATPTERQTALFSATMPVDVRKLADRYMRNPQAVTIKSAQVTVSATEQRYYVVNASDRLAALTRLLEMEDVTSALIFARTRASTSELANELTSRGFPSEVLNGDLSQDARERTLNRFRQGKLTVLVATDVAARGLDIDDISHVFNYELPDDPEVYVHRIGRTGRAGKTGIAITLITPAQRRYLRHIESFTRQKMTAGTIPSEDEIRAAREEQLAAKVRVWLGRARYRRERELVDKLVAEGFDPLEIAAAALKLSRADEKQRPILPMSSDNQPLAEAIAEPAPRSRSYAHAQSHEQGMVRLSLNLGKKQGIRPADIIGTIARVAEIPGKVIGKIVIDDRSSLVDIPEDVVAQVLTRAGAMRIRQFPVQLHRA